MPFSPPEYEVKCPQTWAWYPADIVGFDEETRQFVVKYPNELSCVFKIIDIDVSINI